MQARFIRGLSDVQIRAKVENLAYLLPASFDAYKAAAAFHEKALWRDKGGKISVTEIGETSSKRSSLDSVSTTELQRLLEENKRGLEAHFQKHLLELKKELAVQKQQSAMTQFERLRQSKPPGPCFTCNGDHFKRACPIKLAKEGYHLTH